MCSVDATSWFPRQQGPELASQFRLSYFVKEMEEGERRDTSDVWFNEVVWNRSDEDIWAISSQSADRLEKVVMANISGHEVDITGCPILVLLVTQVDPCWVYEDLIISLDYDKRLSIDNLERAYLVHDLLQWAGLQTSRHQRAFASRSRLWSKESLISGVWYRGTSNGYELTGTTHI
jgi:hypothetical protein